MDRARMPPPPRRPPVSWRHSIPTVFDQVQAERKPLPEWWWNQLTEKARRNLLSIRVWHGLVSVPDFMAYVVGSHPRKYEQAMRNVWKCRDLELRYMPGTETIVTDWENLRKIANIMGTPASGPVAARQRQAFQYLAQYLECCAGLYLQSWPASPLARRMWYPRNMHPKRRWY